MHAVKGCACMSCARRNNSYLKSFRMHDTSHSLQIEAIYHTAIVVGGVEHFYGGGIQEAVPGHTPYGQPIQVLDLG